MNINTLLRKWWDFLCTSIESVQLQSKLSAFLLLLNICACLSVCVDKSSCGEKSKRFLEATWLILPVHFYRILCLKQRYYCDRKHSHQPNAWMKAQECETRKPARLRWQPSQGKGLIAPTLVFGSLIISVSTKHMTRVPFTRWHVAAASTLRVLGCLSLSGGVQHNWRRTDSNTVTSTSPEPPRPWRTNWVLCQQIIPHECVWGEHFHSLRAECASFWSSSGTARGTWASLFRKVISSLAFEAALRVCASWLPDAPFWLHDRKLSWNPIFRSRLPFLILYELR